MKEHISGAVKRGGGKESRRTSRLAYVPEREVSKRKVGLPLGRGEGRGSRITVQNQGALRDVGQ